MRLLNFNNDNGRYKFFCMMAAFLLIANVAVFADDDVVAENVVSENVSNDINDNNDNNVNNDNNDVATTDVDVPAVVDVVENDGAVSTDENVAENIIDNNIDNNNVIVADENITEENIINDNNELVADENLTDVESAEIESTEIAEQTTEQPASTTGNRLDGIAAVIGSELVLISEVEALTYMRLNAMGPEAANVDHAEIRRESLENLINDKVVLVRAMTDTLIHVRNDEIESMLNNHINMILRQNNITLEQFEQHLQTQQGTTLTRFRADARRAIREQLFKQKLQQRLFFDTRVNRREVEQFFAQYADSLPTVGESFEMLKLSVALTPSEAVRQAAHDSAVAIHRRIVAGADFAEVARELGDASGGEFGFLDMGSTTEVVFENRVFALPVGRVSQPFETRFGFHIVLVEERRDRRVRLRQILVPITPSEADRNAALATIDSLRNAIASRHDFEVAARELSSDQATRIRGGNMGWLTQFEMTPAMRQLANSLDVGEMSGVITEDNALTIYMLADRVDERRLTLENDFAAIADMAREIGAQRQLIDNVRRWRERVFIDIRI